MSSNEYVDKSGITRAKFRELIDPMLEGLGLTAQQVKTCFFDADGFKFELFHLDDHGSRVLPLPVSVPDRTGGPRRFGGYAKVYVEVPVSDPPVVRDVIDAIEAGE